MMSSFDPYDPYRYDRPDDDDDDDAPAAGMGMSMRPGRDENDDQLLRSPYSTGYGYVQDAERDTGMELEW